MSEKLLFPGFSDKKNKEIEKESQKKSNTLF